MTQFYTEAEACAAAKGCVMGAVSEMKLKSVDRSGHLPSRVTGKDGKTYPARRPRPERQPANNHGKLDKSLEREGRLRLPATCFLTSS